MHLAYCANLCVNVSVTMLYNLLSLLRVQKSEDRDLEEASSQHQLMQDSSDEKDLEMSSEHQEDQKLSEEGQNQAPLTGWWTTRDLLGAPGAGLQKLPGVTHTLFGLPDVRLQKLPGRVRPTLAFLVPSSTEDAVQQVSHPMNKATFCFP